MLTLLLFNSLFKIGDVWRDVSAPHLASTVLFFAESQKVPLLIVLNFGFIICSSLYFMKNLVHLFQKIFHIVCLNLMGANNSEQDCEETLV